MNALKAIGFLVASVWIGWVAYMAFAVPTDVDEFMNEPMDALDGSSIGQEIKSAQAEARQQHCDQYQDMLTKTWDRAVESNTLERDADRIEHLEGQVERFCN